MPIGFTNNFDNYLICPNQFQLPQFNPKLNLGVMASGKGSNFQALVNASRNSIINANINLLIVNKPQCEAIERAKELEVPYLIIDHKKFNSREEHDNEIINAFKSINVEAVIMAGWMRIVTSKLIEAYPERLVNIHPSLLPSFPGIDAVGQALSSGVQITGCSVHLVKEKVDSGPLLIQSAVPIFPSDDKKTLHQRIQIQEHLILPIGIGIAARNWRGIEN